MQFSEPPSCSSPIMSAIEVRFAGTGSAIRPHSLEQSRGIFRSKLRGVDSDVGGTATNTRFRDCAHEFSAPLSNDDEDRCQPRVAEPGMDPLYDRKSAR